MEKEINAKVIEIILNKYILALNDGKYVEAILSGNIKRKNSILVGDNVIVTFSYDKYVITKVLERKNSMIRPPVANIDQLIIVLSLDSPKPDYMLLDKQIVLCKNKGIDPILCINKIDYSKDNISLRSELKYIATVYTSLVKEIVYSSVTDNIGINELKLLLKGKISAFSGNSGVGKSSIISLITNGKHMNEIKEIEVGAIGKKTGRGKHTTKYVRMYDIGDKSYLLDTPGFSSYELYDIEYKELKKYYDDFSKEKCDYEDCNHVNEKEDVCKVKQGVLNGKIDKLRYERYVYIFNKLKELDKRKYK